MIFVINDPINVEQWTYRGKEGRAYTVAFLTEKYQTGPYSSVQVIESEEVRVQQLFLHRDLGSQSPCLGAQALGAQLSVAAVDNSAWRESGRIFEYSGYLIVANPNSRQIHSAPWKVFLLLLTGTLTSAHALLDLYTKPS